MTDPLSSYDAWVSAMRVSIMGAAIVRQSFDMMRDGRGAPDVDDMRRFAMEAGAIADLWVESLEKADR